MRKTKKTRTTKKISTVSEVQRTKTVQAAPGSYKTPDLIANAARTATARGAKTKIKRFRIKL